MSERCNSKFRDDDGELYQCALPIGHEEVHDSHPNERRKGCLWRGSAPVVPSRSAAPLTPTQCPACTGSKDLALCAHPFHSPDGVKATNEGPDGASAAPPSERPHLVHEAYVGLLRRAVEYDDKDWESAQKFERHAINAALDIRDLRAQLAEARAAVPQAVARHPELRGTWPENCVQRAFVEGAKWWEFYKTGATMWQSDQRLAEKAAVEQYGEPGAAAVPAPGTSRLKELERERRLVNLLHINFCEELVSDGTPWEVPAEPEPQYFDTSDEAIEFAVGLLMGAGATAPPKEEK